MEDGLSGFLAAVGADVLIYLVRLAAKLWVDLDTAISRELEKNVRKYPPGNSTPSR